MSIDNSGLNDKAPSGNISISITDKHPLVQLANAINWQELSEIVLPDIKADIDHTI